MCGFSVLASPPSGDELLTDPELRRVIADSAASEEPLLSRAAVPLAERLGLST